MRPPPLLLKPARTGSCDGLAGRVRRSDSCLPGEGPVAMTTARECVARHISLGRAPADALRRIVVAFYCGSLGGISSDSVSGRMPGTSAVASRSEAPQCGTVTLQVRVFGKQHLSR